MEPAGAMRVHNLTAEGMEFTITETVRASTVEKWLHAVKERFLDAAPVKCVGLDCEFTTPRDKPHRRAALLLIWLTSLLYCYYFGFSSFLVFFEYFNY
jgi:hypothetical protein